LIVLPPLGPLYGPADENQCNHGITFDVEAARGLNSRTVRAQWPRLMGTCPRGCGFSGIYYASYEHYLYGDW
jgi:hypothetical protein